MRARSLVAIPSFCRAGSGPENVTTLLYHKSVAKVTFLEFLGGILNYRFDLGSGD